jgi:hypothetical protein
MDQYDDFSCMFKCPKVDLDDVAATRKVIIAAVNDPSFETMVNNLKVAAGQVKAGPAPRGGEVTAGCHVDGAGRVSCGGTLTIHF